MPGPAIARPGSTAIAGARQPRRGALAGDDRAQLVGHARDVDGVVAGPVGDAEAAAEVERAHRRERLRAVLAVQQREEPDDAVRGDLEPVGVEDLAADVAVQPDQRAARPP